MYFFVTSATSYLNVISMYLNVFNGTLPGGCQKVPREEVFWHVQASARPEWMILARKRTSSMSLIAWCVKERLLRSLGAIARVSKGNEGKGAHDTILRAACVCPKRGGSLYNMGTRRVRAPFFWTPRIKFPY